MLTENFLKKYGDFRSNIPKITIKKKKGLNYMKNNQKEKYVVNFL